MANDLNTFHFTGRLTRDPEVKTVGNTPLVEVGFAINRSWKKKNSDPPEYETDTTFIDGKVWGRVAEQLPALRKGDPVFVEAQLRLDRWEDRNTGERRTKLYCYVDRILLLGYREQVDEARDDEGFEASQTGIDDDMPF